MNRNELIDLMKNGRPEGVATLTDLESVLTEYPYFQTARLLYTIGLKNEQDSRFKSELRKTACYLSDRKTLFFAIEYEDFPPEWLAPLHAPSSPAPDAFELIDAFLSDKKYNASVPFDAADCTGYLDLETAEPKKNVEPLKYQDAIDRFLQKDKEQSGIFRLNRNVENADNELIASEIEEKNSGGFLSETLAKIYIKQRKYDKALEIIRQLNLLYPKKNRYFADQIRFLEKLIIHTKK
ncbi:MAG: tetratricopeptide repeat protein [Candidatus Symbiothrix sp.]|jgi:hypothetical protein|nr:tetratricopeptide repeat protein [Candidatus Symbiothrix sp.]